MKNKSSLTNCFFIILTTCFLAYSYTGRAQVISDTVDTINLDGIQLVELVDYVKGHSFSIEDYLKEKGFNKNGNGKESCYHNGSSTCWVYLTASDSSRIPESIAAIKQDFIVIKSNNSNFKETIEKIIYDLKIDDNFAVDHYKGEYSFYSIKNDYYIKILFNNEYDLIAIF